MTTPNAAQIKKSLQINGVKVLRAVTFGTTVTVTVERSHGEQALSLLNDMGIQQQWNKYAPSTGIKMSTSSTWAEFTALVRP